jgi:uncharacterized membrane protein
VICRPTGAARLDDHARIAGLASITIVGGILLGTIWLYVFPLMVDRGIGLGEAMRTSYEMVRRAGFWEHLALVILLMVVNSIGGPAALVTVPFSIVAVVVAYHAVEGRGDAVERA